MEGFCTADRALQDGFFSFVKKLFSSWATETQQGEKPVRKRYSSTLQISLESSNSTSEKSLFPTVGLCCCTLPQRWVCQHLANPKLCEEQVEPASSSRQKLPPARSASVVGSMLSQGSLLYSSEINLPTIPTEARVSGGVGR